MKQISKKISNSKYWINENSSLKHQFMFMGLFSSVISIIIGLILLILGTQYLYGILLGITLSWVNLGLFFTFINKTKSLLISSWGQLILTIGLGITMFCTIIWGINLIYTDGKQALLEPINSIAFIMGYTAISLSLIFLPILTKKN